MAPTARSLTPARRGTASRSPRADSAFICTGRGPSRKVSGRHRGTLARQESWWHRRPGPASTRYRWDEPGALASASQSPVSQVGSGRAGPVTRDRRVQAQYASSLRQSSPSAGDSDTGAYLPLVRGGNRAAEQTKMSNGQVPPLPGSVATPQPAPGSCPGGSRAIDNKSAIASTAFPPEPDPLPDD